MRTTLWITLGVLTLVGLAIVFNPVAAAGPSFSKQIEPAERAFSLEMPDGWQNALGIMRPPGTLKLPRAWANSRSPDGATNFFVGDPNVPPFVVPPTQQFLQTLQLPPQQAWENFKNFWLQDGIVIMPFQPAQQFAEDYARRRYGNQPGFQILGHSPGPNETTKKTRFEFAGHSGELWVSTEFSAPDKTMWGAFVSGFTTKADRENAHSRAAELFNRAYLSMDINTKWLANDRQQRSQRQAQLALQTQRNIDHWNQQTRLSTQRHQQRMADMNNNFNAHQRAMADQSAAFDTYNQTWQAGQDASYRQSQEFSRYIQDRTVVNSPNSYGDSSFEVDAGANNYYVDPLNNEYFGTDLPLEPGQIPDGYQQATEQWSDW